MDALTKELNDMLVSVYQSIGRMEQQMLKNDSRIELSISEIHFIEAVGSDVEEYPLGKTISELSRQMGITMSSVTLAANKLIKKGFLQKEKSATDGRVAHIKLTNEGRRMYKIHRLFHHTMVSEITGGMNVSDKETLLYIVGRLNEFFKKEVSGS